MTNQKNIKPSALSAKTNVFEIKEELQKVFDQDPETNLFGSKTYIPSKPSTQVFFNTCFDKNNLKTVIAWFLENYGEKMTIDLVETLKQVGFHQATRAGVSLGVDDLQIPPQKATLLSQASLKMETVLHDIETGNVTSVEKSQRLIDTWNQTSETLRQTAVHNFRTTNPVNPVYMMAFSGARGNISQVRQLVAMRGLMADPQGAILEFPIQSNFREGLTVTEYLISCYGARKGLVDTALRTATSGYLTRRLVDAVQHVVVHVTDCHTKNGILIKDKNLDHRLVGRVLLDDLVLNSTTSIKKNTLISQRLAKLIASTHKPLLVRSPLTCQTEKSVCQLCYGIDLAQGKLVSIGEAVGIIAAQSIGEPGTQLTMRTFHTGGVGVFSEQAMKSFPAPFDGKVNFFDFLPGLFVRTPHGNIVYLLKHKTIDETKPILRLTSEVPNSTVYEIKHGDVPSGSLLWVKQGENVKAGQLLIQASRLQTGTQEMPESSHPVRAPIFGEIFFQSMAIRVIEEEKRTLQKVKKKKHQNLITTQINQKEISPTFPTLIKLGNFWIFSSFVQTESGFSNSFFRKGDLFSPDTPIYQYNLKIPKKGQLKQVHSSLVFGSSSTDFLFSKIHYSGLFYFLMCRQEKNRQSVIVYTTSPKHSIFTWYPFFKKFPANISGYCSSINSEINLISPKNLDVLESSKFPVKSKVDFDVQNYIWFPHEVFKVKRKLKNCFFGNSSLLGTTNWEVEKRNMNSCFLLTDHSPLSEKGIFQVSNQRESSSSRKTRLHEGLVKNSFHTQSLNGDFKNHTKQTGFGLKNFVGFVSKTGTFRTKGIGPQNEIFREGEGEKVPHTTPLSGFIKNSLHHVEQLLLPDSHVNVIKKNQIWLYLPQTQVSQNVGSAMTGILLEPGKNFENLRFENSYVSANIIQNKDLVVVKSRQKTNQYSVFYSIPNFLNTEEKFNDNSEKILCFTEKFVTPLVPKTTKKQFIRYQINKFSFYKKQEINKLPVLNFSLKRKRAFSHILLFQKTYHQLVPDKKFLKENWLLQKKIPIRNSVKCPLFTKQQQTKFDFQVPPNWTFKLVSPMGSGWFSLSGFFKIEIQFQSLKTFSKIEQFHHQIVVSNQQLGRQIKPTNQFTEVLFSNYPKIPISGFSLMFYRKIKFQNPEKFSFETFNNGWILPDFAITQAFLKSKRLGEFRGFQTNQKTTSFSLVQTQDLNLFGIPVENKENKNLQIQIGSQVRWGQEIVSGFAVPASGQILKVTEKTLTLRKGIPFLASIRGLIHVSHNDLIEKNDLLITLRSRRLQTEDIVQGIPKIEQLFEARETQGGEIIQNNMHNLLTNFFHRARKVKPINEAVQLSLTYIQKFLVDNILEAYSNQGVQIAEKHVEVVVRQMTARVRITQGGDTGFLPGELVQLRVIEKVNIRLSQLGCRQAHYEPVILGITKSVLQSESFLLAASFQQVSKVLVRSALAKKTDFLRGLHENILVGQPIPAGTGLISPPTMRDEFTDSVDSKDYLHLDSTETRFG